MRARDIEDIEVDLLLEAIFRRYGHDFRNYSKASVRRRVKNIMGRAGAVSVSELIPRILHDEAFFEENLDEFSITVSEMFRDPGFFSYLRRELVPYLKTYPYVKIWHAGCATGEEVYSTAIVLEEEGFYDRVTLFATDFNCRAINQAREGIYPLDKVREFTANYREAGGKRDFADYYHARYGSAILEPSLKRNITFANHNLVTDGVFSEVQLILCRNVLIYFNKVLQSRVLNLFCDSLVHGGFLVLGGKESLQFSSVADKFVEMDRKWRIYQKKVLE
jgi:chemotaxis protein methyltransferase CheR